MIDYDMSLDFFTEIYLLFHKYIHDTYVLCGSVNYVKRKLVGLYSKRKLIVFRFLIFVYSDTFLNYLTTWVNCWRILVSVFLRFQFQRLF